MSMFDFEDHDSVDPTAGGIYFGPGNFHITVRKVVMKKSQDPKKGGTDLFIVETVVDACSPDAQMSISGKMAAVHPGDKLAWMVQSKWGKVALANLKAFSLAAERAIQLQREDDEDFVICPVSLKDKKARGKRWKQWYDGISGPANTLEGLKLGVEGRPIDTQKTKGFTKVMWHQVDDVRIDTGSGIAEEEEDEEASPFN